MSIESRVDAQWREWRQQARGQGLSVPAGPRFETSLKRVWEASDYVLQACHREPSLLLELFDSGRLEGAYGPGEMARQLEEWLAPVADEPSLARQLRRFRRYQMVRIIWRDIAGWAPLAEVLEDLSALADAVIQQALAYLDGWTRAELGSPRDSAGEPQPLVVLGMGKLGARELNLSSDIDLIFAYPEAGHTDAARPTTNEQFFIRLCQHLVRALDSHDADGFVFRVDTRLRPFGDAGPLAMSFDAMEGYYHSQAREWERYAMIKARVVSGPAWAAQRLMEILRPFVYRRYLDFGAIDSLRQMKRLIGKELYKKGMETNIKLGPGGIREIEFIGQAFQLIRGGRDPELQIRPILAVLERLRERDLLPGYVVQELSAAYRFLRRVENRLQAWADQQTHRLPADEEGRLRLARAMEFPTWDAFHKVLDGHRKRVQGHFDMLFAAPQAEADEGGGGLGGLWFNQLEQEAALRELDQAGFSDPAEALRHLEQFRGGHACRALGSRGRERLDQLMPLLLEAVSGAEEPDQALGRVLRLVEAITRRTAYLALLVENPIALSQLVRLCGMSPWIAERLTRQPILLDELLDPRRLYAPLKRRELEQELHSQLAGVAEADLERQMEGLRLFVQSNKLRVAAADITGRIPLMVVSDYLTEIAETAIARVMELAFNELVRRHGRPPGLAAGETGLVVVGYGKLGGIELGYGSDLDMVFLHGIDDPLAETDGPKPLAVDLFYARLARRMIHIFTTRTPAGILYEVDMRLRPHGNSGMMISPMRGFETYQMRNAWTWEHQALVRARAVAGDARVDARFEAVRRRVLTQPRDGERLRAEVVAMREKMRVNLDRGRPGLFDLKQGRGGIVDIEFMVQYLVLRWASQHPELLGWTDNVRLLEGLARCGRLSGEAARQTMDAYRAFRAAYHHNTLQDRATLVADDRLVVERERVRALWIGLMES